MQNLASCPPQCTLENTCLDGTYEWPATAAAEVDEGSFMLKVGFLKKA